MEIFALLALIGISPLRPKLRFCLQIINFYWLFCHTYYEWYSSIGQEIIENSLKYKCIQCIHKVFTKLKDLALRIVKTICQNEYNLIWIHMGFWVQLLVEQNIFVNKYFSKLFWKHFNDFLSIVRQMILKQKTSVISTFCKTMVVNMMLLIYFIQFLVS